MQILTLFFIVGVLVIGCFGAIAAIGSSSSMANGGPTNQTDTFGASTSAGTNHTSQLVTTTIAYEDKGISMGALLVGICVVICIIFGFFMVFRKKTPGFGKYRT